MRVSALLMALVVLAGCSRKPAAPAAPASAPPAAASASGVVPAAPAGPDLVTVSGTVLETIDVAEYTYMRLKTAGGETWAAVNKAKIARGDAVTVTNAMAMNGFESKTLNRTFDKIVFGVLGTPGAAAPAAGAGARADAASLPMMSNHPPTAGTTGGETPQQMAAQHGQAAGGPEDAPDVKVDRAEGKNARTVAELWAQRGALRGKEVTVKAKVVKVTSGVMGRNWLHVRDGSGSKAAKDNDLAVTTEATAKVGDVVTVTGLVSTDKDFGAGYSYPVIVENARLAK